MKLVGSNIRTLLLGVTLFGLVLAPLAAESKRFFESDIPADDLQSSVDKALRKIDPDGFVSRKETAGFRFVLGSRWISPFSYEIYGGTISASIKQSILRFEGRTGDIESIARVIELEKVLKDETVHPAGSKPSELSQKSHGIAQGLNLLAPWMGVLYSSYHSPRLTTGQTVFRFFTYFLLDAFVIYASGSDLFRQSYNATDNTQARAAGLILLRVIGSSQQFNLTRGHNRLAELKYTFYLDN